MISITWYIISFGVRLPEPKLCPEIVADLMKTCFCEKSDKRPYFKAIKVTVLSAYNGLVSNSQFVEKSSRDNKDVKAPPSIHEVKNHHMQNRYSSLLKGNQKLKRGDLENNQKLSTKDDDVDSIEYLMIEHNDATRSQEDCEENLDL